MQHTFDGLVYLCLSAWTGGLNCLANTLHRAQIGEGKVEGAPGVGDDEVHVACSLVQSTTCRLTHHVKVHAQPY